MGSGLRAAIVLGLAATACMNASACNGREQLPPLPEVLVVVDTDLPVPLIASRLRIDLYAEDGTWFESNDVARPSPSEWPVSFSVYSDDESRARSVWVRLRAYPEGRQTDYRGERFRGWDAPFAEPPGDGNPRLVRAGVDVTPTSEPPHLLTVDRLLLVSLVPEKKGKVSVVLRGSCVGSMSRLGDRGLPGPGAETCIDTPKTLSPVEVAPSTDVTPVEPTLVGSFQREPCRPEETTEEKVCVEGGATLFGTNGVTEYAPGVSQTASPAPARVFALKKFLVDRNEVTVGEYRTKIGTSWKGPLPAPNEGPLRPTDTTDPNSKCTWSDVKRDREGYPLNCIEWDSAQIYCKAKGGDLLTEVQWEHLTTVASRPTKTRYPSGDQLPSCDAVVFGRNDLGTAAGADCTKKGIGPALYSENANDVSPSGVVALHGGLSEWVLGTPDAYTSACWRDAPLVDPRCLTPGDDNRVIRGAAWSTPPFRGTFRLFSNYLEPGAAVGFRCAYPAVQP